MKHSFEWLCILYAKEPTHKATTIAYYTRRRESSKKNLTFYSMQTLHHTCLIEPSYISESIHFKFCCFSFDINEDSVKELLEDFSLSEALENNRMFIINHSMLDNIIDQDGHQIVSICISPPFVRPEPFSRLHYTHEQYRKFSSFAKN